MCPTNLGSDFEALWGSSLGINHGALIVVFFRIDEQTVVRHYAQLVQFNVHPHVGQLCPNETSTRGLCDLFRALSSLL
jgi:hypothetical protein